MDIKSKHKVDSAFSMSSMTDIVFLLLIFFMLTSSFITPSGLPVDLPSAAATSISLQKISVTVGAGNTIYVNDKEVTLGSLENELSKVIEEPGGTVSLHLDKTITAEIFVKVTGIIAKLEQKTNLVAKSE